MALLILIALYVSILMIVALREQIVLGKQSSRTWEELVGSLYPARMEGFIKAAAALGIAGNNQPKAAFGERFSAIGGAEGLRRVQRNALVFMSLAAYIEMWSVDAKTGEIARLRQDGVHLRRTATKLRLVSKIPWRQASALRYLKETAELYCGMVERLLAMCEVTHVARYPGLLAAVS